MKCPFCEENLIEGDLICPNCRSMVIDFDYLENIERADHFGGDGEVSDGCRQDETFSNLSKRLREIKNG